MNGPDSFTVGSCKDTLVTNNVRKINLNTGTTNAGPFEMMTCLDYKMHIFKINTDFCLVLSLVSRTTRSVHF